MGRRMGRWRVVLGVLAMVMGLYLWWPQAQLPVQAAAINGKGRPSATPVGVFGFYLNTGFSLQPEDRYTYLNAPGKQILTTDTAHSMWAIVTGLTASDHFQWYQSTDAGQSWSKVNKGQQSDLTLPTDKVGTTYYQQSFQYYTIVPIPFVTATYFSRVATVETLPTPVDATKLTVTSDNHYLYNNQVFDGKKVAATTYVHATPEPANATGELTWTSSDPTLATVDAHTGKVTANTAEKAGSVTITGTLTNHDQSTITDHTTIDIGGGLMDQSAAEGQTATFHVLGGDQQAPDQVDWYRLASGSSQVTKVATIKGAAGLTYTTPATKKADDQAKYYATATYTMYDEQEKPQTQTVTTRQATLTVQPDTTPDVRITSKVKNLTDSTGDTDQQLSNVITGDHFTISGTLQDANGDTAMADGDLIISIPGSAQVTNLTVDDAEAQYYVKVAPDGLSKQLIVSGVQLDWVFPKSFRVTLTSQQSALRRYSTRVQLISYDSKNQQLGTYQGDPLTINFTDGNLHATANPVNFGTVGPAELGQDVPAQGQTDLLDVTDYRREKAATQVGLQQVTPFQNGTQELPATLNFDNGQGRRLPITADPQPVAEIAANQSVPTIGPSQGQRLDFHLNALASQLGHYTATIQWTFISGPQG